MKVAAIQMVSAAQLAPNLVQARVLLEQAAAQGAELAVLPEHFYLLGHRALWRRADAGFPLIGSARAGPVDRRRHAAVVAG